MKENVGALDRFVHEDLLVERFELRHENEKGLAYGRKTRGRAFHTRKLVSAKVLRRGGSRLLEEWTAVGSKYER